MNRFWLSDETNNSSETFTTGSTIFIEGRGLRPLTLYDFRLLSHSSNEAATLLARYTTDRHGALSAMPLIPCIGSLSYGGTNPNSRVSAEQIYTIRAGASRSSESEAEELSFLVTARKKRRQIFSCDERGRIQDGLEKGSGPISIALQNFPAGQLRVLIVPRQFGWQVGDPIHPVITRNGAKCGWLIEHDGAAKRVVKLAESHDLPAGGYQFVARVVSPGCHEPAEPFLLRDDVVSDRQSTSLVIRLPFQNQLESPSVATGIIRRPLTRRPLIKMVNKTPLGTDVYAAFDLEPLPSGLASDRAAIYVCHSAGVIARRTI